MQIYMDKIWNSLDITLLKNVLLIQKDIHDVLVTRRKYGQGEGKLYVTFLHKIWIITVKEYNKVFIWKKYFKNSFYEGVHIK